MILTKTAYRTEEEAAMALLLSCAAVKFTKGLVLIEANPDVCDGVNDSLPAVAGQSVTFSEKSKAAGPHGNTGQISILG